MKKQKYVSPACIAVEMESEDLFLAGSLGGVGEEGGFGERPGKGEFGDLNAVEENPGGGHYDVWDD